MMGITFILISLCKSALPMWSGLEECLYLSHVGFVGKIDTSRSLTHRPKSNKFSCSNNNNTFSWKSFILMRGKSMRYKLLTCTIQDWVSFCYIRIFLVSLRINVMRKLIKYGISFNNFLCNVSWRMLRKIEEDKRRVLKVYGFMIHSFVAIPHKGNPFLVSITNGSCFYSLSFDSE